MRVRFLFVMVALRLLEVHLGFGSQNRASFLGGSRSGTLRVLCLAFPTILSECLPYLQLSTTSTSLLPLYASRTHNHGFFPTYRSELYAHPDRGLPLLRPNRRSRQRPQSTWTRTYPHHGGVRPQSSVANANAQDYPQSLL